MINPLEKLLHELHDYVVHTTLSTLQSPVSTYFAPGRVNLLGEHLDYNGGWVLPIAIEIGIAVAVQKRNDAKIFLTANGHSFQLTTDISELPEFNAANDWTNYPIGVIKTLVQQLDISCGYSFYFISNLPEGSGLSSSAALEVVTAYALLQENNFPTNRIQIAQLCQRVENDFIGVKCGIMDQFAVANGQQNHALLLNCNTLHYETVPFELDDYSLLVMNTKKPRSLIKSAYNERKQSCIMALAEIQTWKPSLQHLAQATMEDVLRIKEAEVQKRARHVVSEQLRVLQSVKALERGDLHTFGRLMNASHQSLKIDYEVTGIELDTLVETAQEIASCLGARMTGAGFGGCAIALVRSSEIDSFTEIISQRYEDVTGLSCDIYHTKASDGVRKIS